MNNFDRMQIVDRHIYPRDIFDRCIFMREGSDPVYCYARLVHSMAKEIDKGDPLKYYIHAIHYLYSIFQIAGPQSDIRKPIIKLKKQGAK